MLNVLFFHIAHLERAKNRLTLDSFIAFLFAFCWVCERNTKNSDKKANWI